jgi:RecB family exonuclease
VITPRRTRLVRVPSLPVFRTTVVSLCAENPGALVVVPSGGAARQLARTVAARRPDVGSAPHCVTRDELYAELHGRLDDPPRRLSAFEREAIAERAALDSAGRTPGLTFHVRPGLVREMLWFYDQIRRQAQQVKRFEELIEAALGGEAALDDRGASRLLHQTRFLALAFSQYERLLVESGACDEHVLRDRLMVEPAREPVRHVIVTVADWIADPAGLFVADFDLLARLPGLFAIEIVCTERVLASGFHERIHRWLPGLEESDRIDAGAGPPPPRLLRPVPDGSAAERLWFEERDREDELARVARRCRSAIDAGDLFAQDAIERVAVVFKRPLPYLYLAPATLGAAGLPYQSGDALPLAAQPAAAALDLVLDAIETDFSRDAIVALLRSPHYHFPPLAADAGGDGSARKSIKALDRGLSEARYLGGLPRLESFAPDAAARLAWDAALAASRSLASMSERAPASTQLRRLATFLRNHARHLETTMVSEIDGGEVRAREVLLTLLDSLASAHQTHHDPDWTAEELAASVRRWIEDETFVRDPSAAAGLHLVDDQAARYGEFTELAIVGLIEHEWPEAPRRNIFYSAGLLKALGWPGEADRRAADQARFLDLLTSPSARVAVSTPTLENEALTTRSVYLDEIARARLSTVAEDGLGNLVLPGERLSNNDPLDPCTVPDGPRTWASLRLARPDGSDASFHGQIEARDDRVWSVSALETYLACPFKFYAQHILRLEEDPEDEEVMDPRREGLFVHSVFEDFFRQWTEEGRGNVTPGNLTAARQLFARVVDTALAPFSEAEAGLERTRLLGSPAAAGLGDAVFRMEAERPVRVVERFLERRFTRPLQIEGAFGPRTVHLRGKADRIDLLDDGTFRLIDYKLGWPPNRARALQLPIYGLIAEQELAGYRGQRWTLAEAVYLAFKGPKRVVPLFSSPTDRSRVLADAQERLDRTLHAIAHGEFPPTPDDVYRCETCRFAAVCRKDYVGDR